MKGLSPLVSMVLVVAFGIASMFIVLTIVNPMLDRAKDSATVNEITQNMLLIDSVVKTVASESEGSKRSVNIKITEGVLRTNSTLEWVYFDYEPKSRYELDGFSGDIQIVSRAQFLEYFNQYVDGDSASEWGRYNGTWSIDSTRLRGLGGVAYRTLGNISNFEYTGTIVRSAEPEGQIFLLPVSPRDLSLYLPFDGNINDTHRTAFDYSGNQSNGTFSNITAATCFTNGACPAWVVGRFGNGTEYDGLGDYINVTTMTNNFSSGMTVAFWVNVRGNGTNILAKGIDGTTNFWRIYNTTGFRVEFTGTGDTNPALTSTTTITINTWYHVVLTYTGSHASLYINGVNETGAVAFTRDNTHALLVGGAHMSGGLGALFNGTIDELMIFNRSLVAPEVAFLYETSIKKITAGGKEFPSVVEDANVTVVLSSPGTNFFDNIKVKYGKPNIRFVLPYPRIDIEVLSRFGPGYHNIQIKHNGTNSTNNRPLIRMEE